MAENTKIEWCDATFNPWMGCTKVSPACQHCYAERDMDHRYGKVAWGPGVWLGTSVENQEQADIGSVCDDPKSSQDALCHIDWIIAGGESGPNARPMQVEWIESIADQCRAASVPVFIKQDSGPRSGMQGRISDSLWNLKEFPQ